MSDLNYLQNELQHLYGNLIIENITNRRNGSSLSVGDAYDLQTMNSIFFHFDYRNLFYHQNDGEEEISDNELYEEIERYQLQQAMEESAEISGSSNLKKNETIILDVTSQPYTKKEDVVDVCAVCQDQLENNDETCLLSCQHLFHNKCISEWGCYKPECPICRCSIKIKPN